jgi:predicted transcriptional regulator
MNTIKKTHIIPAVPEQKVELYKIYGPSVWLHDSKNLNAYVYVQFSTIEGFAKNGLVKKFLSLKESKEHMMYKVKDRIEELKNEIEQLNKLFNKIKNDEFEIKELEDDINGRG